MLDTLHASLDFIFNRYYYTHSTGEILSVKEVQYFALSFVMSKQQIQDRNPVLWDSKAHALSLLEYCLYLIIIAGCKHLPNSTEVFCVPKQLKDIYSQCSDSNPFSVL